MGWALPNPVTRMNGERTGVPFAYLEPATAQTAQTVTLTITDSAASSAKNIEGAKVVIDGAKLVTNSEGKVTCKLTAGDYTVKVSATGYKTTTTTITVAAAAVTQTIKLADA